MSSSSNCELQIFINNKNQLVAMIASTLDRRGRLTDIHVVLDRSSYLKGFVEILTKEDVSHSYESLGQPGRVDLYITDNVKQTKKKQNQQEEYVGSKSCAIS